MSTKYSLLISKYRNKYSDKHPNKYRPKIIRRVIPFDADLSSVLGVKRNYNDAFNQETYDDFRYGQHIGNGYFTNNIGHNATTK